MNIIKLSDNFLQRLAVKSLKGKYFICGSGIDRTAIAINNDIIIKIPNYTQNYEQKKQGKVSFQEEEQTIAEVRLLEDFPFLKEYVPGLLKVGRSVSDIYVTFWERVTPITNDEYELMFSEGKVKRDITNLINKMKKQVPLNTPLEISDLHLGNFGYNKKGEIKILDFGMWGWGTSYTEEFNICDLDFD